MPMAPPVHKRKAAGRKHGQVSATDRQRTRYYHTASVAWRTIRRQALAAGMWTCVDCKGPGNEVDHIDGDTGNNAPENLVVRCKPCHARRTARTTLNRSV